MKNIIIAGAGHGGLSAAAILAKNGYNVTVYEKSLRKNLGHDWHDAMDTHAFEFADIPIPTKSDAYYFSHAMSYFNPKKTVKLVTGASGTNTTGITIDRKFLINYLIDHCESCGVKFVFEAEVLSAITDDTKVLGIKIKQNDKEVDVFGDMIIDASGMFSPLKKTLPDSFNIEKDFDEKNIFQIFRAYYENTDKYISDPPYSVFFFNCNKPGIDWVITEDGFIDVLIGKFGKITQEEIDTSLADLRKEYPSMGDKVIRGGCVASIPLSKTIPMIVANSYAAIGDCAGMTVPLNGSGIDLSLKAGKLLASAVISASKNGYRKEDLWQYQYRYFTLFGNGNLPVYVLRKFFSVITADDVDYFLEKKILTEKEINMSGGNFSSVDLAYIIDKIKSCAPLIKLLPPLVDCMKNVPRFSSINQMMPAVWDEKQVEKWISNYKEL